MLASTAKRPTSIDQLISPALSARLDRLDLMSRRVFAGRLHGERRSKRRGQSVEFADHRSYVPGDDLRRIDWNVFARLDKFFIKIFQEEEDLSLHLVLDASASMDAGATAGGEGNKLLFAQRLAMALGYIGLVNNNRLAVSVFDARTLQRLPPMRGRRNIQRLGRFLLDAVAAPAGPAGAGVTGPSPAIEESLAGRGDFTSALRAIALSRTGKGVMVVLSDFLIHEGYEEGLRYLAGGGGGSGGYDTYCMQILSPGELDPGAPGATAGEPILGDLRLTDVETGREAEVTITAELLKRYKETVDRYTTTLKAFCTSRGMSYALVRSDTDLETLLLEYLRKRGLLK